MPDRRGRSYREWSSDDSLSDSSESDHGGQHLPLPNRARTLAVEPSPFTVSSSQAAMPFAIDVSASILGLFKHYHSIFPVVFVPS
jgi:hypothetical protein